MRESHSFEYPSYEDEQRLNLDSDFAAIISTEGHASYEGYVAHIAEERHEKIRAADNESYSFAGVSGRKQWLVIRGISDWGQDQDSKEREKWQLLATTSAACFAHRFLTHGYKPALEAWPLNRPVTKEKLSFDDVQEALTNPERGLVKWVAEFKPEIIFGINRGGAILGGLLAKQIAPDLKKAGMDCPMIVHPLEVSQDKSTGKIVCSEHRPRIDPIGKRVLVVDDTWRSGSSLTAAVEELERNHPGLVWKGGSDDGQRLMSKDLRAAVLLYWRPRVMGPPGLEYGDKVKVMRPHKYAYEATNETEQPWDP